MRCTTCCVSVRSIPFLNVWPLVLAVLVLLCQPLRGDALRTQTINLEEGWNAVFVEVDPEDNNISAVMADVPVDRVASFATETSSAQFSSDEQANLMNLAGWDAWYRDDHPHSFLSTLKIFYGGQAYLVHATEPAQLVIEGHVRFNQVDWKADRFNFVGFSVEHPGGPTYEEFFSGSAAHSEYRIYELTNNKWRKVIDPSAEVLRSGKAFWIFCNGPSSFQGPLRVEPNTFSGMVVNDSRQELKFYNDTGYPVSLELTHVAGEGLSVPFNIEVKTVKDSDVTYLSFPVPQADWSQEFPALEPGESRALPLVLRTEDMQEDRQLSALKVTSDNGAITWMPLYGARP